MRPTLILNLKEFSTQDYFEKLYTLLQTLDLSKLSILICPAVHFLRSAQVEEICKLKNVKLCSQIVHYENGTGMMRGEYLTNSKYVLCGHADHKLDFKKQVAETLKYDLIPVIFIQNLQDTFAIEAKHLWVYEPHNKIGQSTAEDLSNIKNFVSTMKVKYGFDEVVLYGGSVNQDNAKSILAYCDGLCIGRASRDLEQVGRMISGS